MALHTYTPTEWKNAPDHKTTPINATNLNNIETGIENAYTDIGTINTAVEGKAEADDLTPISETGSTASQAIGARTFFYLEGTLVRAKVDIASGATFTLNTNYEVVSAGALNNLGGATIDVSNVIQSEVTLSAGQTGTYNVTEPCYIIYFLSGNSGWSASVILNEVEIAYVYPTPNGTQVAIRGVTPLLLPGDVVKVVASGGQTLAMYKVVGTR